jgi:eukaryotic-like serine/threonine-protein kinase
VLLGFDASVRITDFGIAKAVGQSVETRTGVLKGKPSYMSPEQLRFEEIDQRSDFFSLGLLLFEMLSGRRAYPSGGRDLASVARRIIHEPPPDIAEIRPEAPDALAELLFELMAKTAGDRPSSAAEIARRLRALAIEVSADEEPAPLEQVLELRFADERIAQHTRVQSALSSFETTRGARVRKRRTWIGAVIVAVILLAALASIAAVVASRNTSSSPPPIAIERAPAPEPPAVPSVEPIPVRAPIVLPEVEIEPPALPRRTRVHNESPNASTKRRTMDRWEWPDR